MPKEMSPQASGTIFVVHASVDDAKVQELKLYLAPVLRDLGHVWDDSQLEKGKPWKPQLDSKLRDARAAVLIVTQEFLNSDFIRDVEVPYVLARAETAGLYVFPLFWNPSTARRVRFEFDDANEGTRRLRLTDLQAPWPLDAPLNARSPADKQAALVGFADYLYELLERREVDEPSPPFPVPEMVRIEPGSFLMGSDPAEPGAGESEAPEHRVQIARPFELGQYAVTFDEFDAFCRATGRKLAADQGWGRGRRPVINVSHEDASAYVAWLEGELGPGWRLPSEAEWEYACRAGTTGPFSFDGPISAERVNYNANYTFKGSKKGKYREKTVEVGSLPANPFGLHEMHGNVWEWVEDCWHATYDGAPDDGSAWMEDAGGDCTRAVVRGGSWYDFPQFARSAFRFGSPRNVRFDVVGFRVARTLPG
jgi:formylglycine-generating enzyme required for sulfatase activity